MAEYMEKCYTFKKSSMKLKDLLPLFRSSGYSNYDEAGSNLIICPECEEWTWAKFNLHSGLLDLLGDLDVTYIDTDDGDIKVWVETKAFNYFLGDREEALINS